MSKKTLIIIISSIIAVVATVTAVLVITNNNVKYTVTFNSDGGNLVEQQIVKKGDKVTKPTDPIKEGYKFISWTYQNETYNFSLEVTSDMELKAKWYEIKEDVKEYTVKFNTDGGTTVENQIVEEGKKVEKPKAPTKEGYTFKGWYLNDKEYDFETEVTKNIELEAKWEEIKVPVNNNNNTNNGNNTTNNIKEETIKVETPTLSVGLGYPEGAAINTELTIFVEGYYTTEDKINSISGWELYEKVGSNYNPVNGHKASIDVGESKTYVARAYKLNKKNEKVYSAYSNELKIDNSKVETPTLSVGLGYPEGAAINTELTIFVEGYYTTEDKINSISGWELYEKVGSNYNPVNGHKASIDVGESKTYVARAYKLNKKNEKVYSAYSNELKIDNSKVETPTLSVGLGYPEGAAINTELTIFVEGYYTTEDKINSISGWELYEKVGSNYNPVNGHKASIDVGESKTYVARAYKLNKKNEKVYSAYSNELKIDNSN